MSRFIKTVLICIILFFMLPCISGYAKSNDASSFWIKFIDVGQGDAALVQCDGHYMLIDGGSSDNSSRIYSILKTDGIAKLDYMIATHADADHIGGLSGALNYSKTSVCYCPVTKHDTKTFKSLNKYLKKQKVSITVPESGDKFKLGSAQITVLGPVGEIDDSNDSSIVVKIEYGKNSFLLMGDAEDKEEKQILDKWKKLDCDVIKIAHHGSDSSTSQDFLKAVKPEYAIISVGADNTYGHPAQGVLDRIAYAKAAVYRTDQVGDITVISDGTSITIETQKPLPAKDSSSSQKVAPSEDTTYVLNKNTKKFHLPTCSSVNEMKSKNRKDVTLTREEVVAQGYEACKRCKP